MENRFERPLFNIVIKEDEEDSGMIRNSLVYSPAVRQELFKFSADFKQKKLMFEASEKEQIFTSISILADTPIARMSEDGREFDVVFSKDVIRKIRNKLIKDGKANELTLNHDDSQVVEGVYLVETYILNHDRLKSELFKDAPEGSLVTSYWVEDKATYDKLAADDRFGGFSIELSAMLQHMFSDVDEDTRLVMSDEDKVKVLELLSSTGQSVPENWQEKTIDEYNLAMENGGLIELSDTPTDSISKNDLKSKKNNGEWLVRYKYEGPRDEKNRDFCNEILMLDKIYTEEQIKNSLRNNEFGTYNIFDFKGSYGCRHRWDRKIYFASNDDDEVRKVGFVPDVVKRLKDSDAIQLNYSEQEIRDIVFDDSMEDAEKEALIKDLIQKH